MPTYVTSINHGMKKRGVQKRQPHTPSDLCTSLGTWVPYRVEKSITHYYSVVLLSAYFM